MAITKDDIKSQITLEKTEVSIDLSRELKGLSKEVKAQISADVADLVRREVGDDAVNNARSSVTGMKFKKLSKEYKAQKVAAGKGGTANLLLNGDMLGSLKKSSTVQTVKLKITKAKEIKKFYNHNFGDTVPKRQALPNKGEGFRSGIMKKINKVISDARKNQE
jgi:hypothetical protein